MPADHGPHLSYHGPSNGTQQDNFNKCKTYLAMIAFILQDSPDKMLTFSQLMDRLEACGCQRTRSFENNIRVCLSSNRCFVKMAISPVDPWNNWRLDHSKITEKMARRHLKGLLGWFPEFTSMERKKMLTTPPPPPDYYTTLHSPEAAACKAVNSRCEVKFSSSFSIDSILKMSKMSEESSVSVKVEQKKPSWSTERTVGLKMKFTWDSLPVDTHFVQCTGDSYSSYTTGGSTDHRLTGDGASRPTKRIFTSPDPSSAMQQERFNECKTYVAMIAFILQHSPKQMLTFSQLMNRLESFGSVRTKSFENNIRVCLSTHTCFVKISFSPESPCNYWRLDHSKITEKMVHRHFEGLLEWFPELTPLRKEMLTTPPPPDHYTTLHSHEAAACKAVNSRCEVKFSSSFSIESILKKDSPSGLCCKASPLPKECSVSVKVERQPNWPTARTVGVKRKLNWDSSPVDTHSITPSAQQGAAQRINSLVPSSG